MRLERPEIDDTKPISLGNSKPRSIVTGLRSFLDAANVYRWFFHNPTKIAAPLSKLLTEFPEEARRKKSKHPIELNKARISAVEEILRRVCSHPVLVLRKEWRETPVYTVACSGSIAATKFQPTVKWDGIRHTVEYWWRIVNKVERNYSMSEKFHAFA